MKKLTSIFLLSATMILASCGGKPADSKPVDSATSPAESTTSQTSSNAGTSTTSQAPATSTTSQAPAASSSSQAPAASSSSQAPASSSEQEQKSIAYTSGGIVKENDKIYVKVGGTIAGYTAAEAKMAFGLQHKAKADSGLADEHDGEWLVGSETPAATDFTITPTITGTAFEVKVEVTNVAFTEGAYAIYLGTADSYARVTMTQDQWAAGSKIKTGNVRIIMRGDASLISAEAMPGLIVTESTVILETVEEVQKPFLKIGGEFGAMDKDAFEAAQIAVRLERQLNGGWTSVDFTGTNVVKLVEENDTKGYLKLDLSSVQEGGYQVKISYNNGAAYPNTDMECASFDARGTANAKVLGDKEYAPYFDAEHNDKDHLYACAGLFVSHRHLGRPETKVADSDLYLTACTCGLKAYDLDAVDCTGKNNPTIGDSTAQKNTRLGSNESDVWNVTGIEPGIYDVQLDAAVKSDTYWDALEAINHNDPAGNNGNATVSTMRYSFQAGTDEAVQPTAEIGAKKYTETGLKAYQRGLSDVLCQITIAPGTTSFKVNAMNVGYSMWIFGVHLTKVGNYVYPPVDVVFTEGQMKIEAENYSLKHTIFTNSGEEVEYTCTNSAYPANLDGTVTDDEEASGGKYVHAVFREGWNGQKNSNMSGELQYKVNLAAETQVKIQARVKSDQTTEQTCFDLKVDGQRKTTFKCANEWIDVLSAEMTLAAGVHTISFVGTQKNGNPYTSFLADLDYFNIVEVPAAE